MPSVSNDAVVSSIRRFSRFYTQRLGVLNQGLLESSFSLTEVRVLYELAHRPNITATELGSELGLDPGYLSRMLTRFQKLKLITRRRAEHDGRQAALNLSTHGKKIFDSLDDRSNESVQGLIGHLTKADQRQLSLTMQLVQHLLSPPNSARPEVTLRAPLPGDLGWVVQRHGAIYAEEYGWDSTFEALVARIVSDFVQTRNSFKERCWIAEMDGVPVGSIFLIRQTDTVAKLRLLLVEPSARGVGIGRKLVDECARFARSAGYRKITLWTNSILQSARRIYEDVGFKLVRSEPHHSFGHELVGQYWELPLD